MANKKGIHFNKPVYSISDEEQQRLKIKKHNQDNFDILFNNCGLLKKLKDIFEDNNNKYQEIIIGKQKKSIGIERKICI